MLIAETLIIGGSGYAGAELARYVARHPQMRLAALAVSEHSQDAGKTLARIHPQLAGLVDLPLQRLSEIAPQRHFDLVFLATDHQVSHDLAPRFVAQGSLVCDLSGAYRVNDLEFYQQFYGLQHQHGELLAQAVYGLAEWQQAQIRQAQLIAVPGCYPTAAQLALKPLVAAGLLDLSQCPVINATSGVSGAGRKAALNTSFCEVSLQPYGLFSHRHQPEIARHLGIEVIFIPQLGNFVRGILATITCRLQTGVSQQQVAEAFQRAYGEQPLVRLTGNTMPAIKNVAGLPYCDLGFAMQGQYLVVAAAEDNLLKGAAAQAIQCANIRFGLPQTLGLL